MSCNDGGSLYEFSRYKNANKFAKHNFSSFVKFNKWPNKNAESHESPAPLTILILDGGIDFTKTAFLPLDQTEPMLVWTHISTLKKLDKNSADLPRLIGVTGFKLSQL